MKIKTIGLAKETESPENPQALEKRVALIPKDVSSLVRHGCTVFFERDAGKQIGYQDSEYEKVGAVLQGPRKIYVNKDMLVKLKGPALINIEAMRKGSILFCMAHFRSFPKRARLLENQQINVIAMEEIFESPKFIPDEILLSKCFVQRVLDNQSISRDSINIGFLGFHSKLVGGIRRAGNRNTNSLTIYQESVHRSELLHLGANAFYFYDARYFKHEGLLTFLRNESCQLFDLDSFESSNGLAAIQEYRETHLPHEFGLRKIQCLRETGVAGARYGFELLKNISPKKKAAHATNVVVLGYGNVGMGAIEECYQQGVRAIHILSRQNTSRERIVSYLSNADLIINGAEQPPKLRGKNYLVTSEHVENVIRKGSVVIDLIGGSEENRSPVEDVLKCTFLTDPHFIKNGIFFSALWGWPMMGMLRESTIKYSRQIVEVLIGRDKLIEGLTTLSASTKPALVCGPYSL